MYFSSESFTSGTLEVNSCLFPKFPGLLNLLLVSVVLQWSSSNTWHRFLYSFFASVSLCLLLHENSTVLVSIHCSSFSFVPVQHQGRVLVLYYDTEQEQEEERHVAVARLRLE